MITIGHHDYKSYEKYNQRVLAGEDFNGRPIMYTNALQQEREHLDLLKVIFVIYLF
jgi:hypothetical protein